MANKQQFNIYLPSDLIRRIKHAAIEKDKSLSVYVEELLGTKVDAPPAALRALTLMPIVYVRSMANALRFYQVLGLTIRHEGDTWSELSLGDAVLALHRGDPKTSGASPMGLAFVSHGPLESLTERLRQSGIDQPLEMVDEAYGRSVRMQDPDGLPIQINEHDPDLHKS